jgi:hypothetical protein
MSRTRYGTGGAALTPEANTRTAAATPARQLHPASTVGTAPLAMARI